MADRGEAGRLGIHSASPHVVSSRHASIVGQKLGQKQCDGGTEDQFLVDSKISCFHRSMTVRVVSSPAARACVTARLDAAFFEWDVPFLHAERTTLPRPLKGRIRAEFQIKRVTVSKSYNEKTRFPT